MAGKYNLVLGAKRGFQRFLACFLRVLHQELTNFDDKKLQELIQENATFEAFFQQASLNPNARLITGVICGYRVEEIEDPLTQQVRYLDTLVDELAKGRKMEKILRGS